MGITDRCNSVPVRDHCGVVIVPKRHIYDYKELLVSVDDTVFLTAVRGNTTANLYQLPHPIDATRSPNATDTADQSNVPGVSRLIDHHCRCCDGWPFQRTDAFPTIAQ
ncbi:hypothetical protein [Halocatena marina]|uniref:Uncharacterized protein n=1 Tax=Halocatena marina TaxID=2934937 RepID=A0ABD5YJN2_9EURY|nr:hypothetical protein [Halocatena marina]